MIEFPDISMGFHMLAVIGGSGLTQLGNLEVTRREVVRTPFGEPSGALTFGRLGGRDAVFLARHGYGHTIPPHRVNYRANLWALVKAAGADSIVSVASVGGIRSDLSPGTLVVPDQIIDYTWGRNGTFHEGNGEQVIHTDFTEPYDRDLRRQLLVAAQGAGEAIVDGGIYAATQGPRLETAAEVNRLERDGADLIGMTGMPEASLARELDVPYAAVCVVANWAAGRRNSEHAVDFAGIEDVLRLSLGRVRRVLEYFCAEKQ
jgi:5'-methylthioadenosine phosphorylase